MSRKMRVLQVKTVWFVAWRLLAGLLTLAALALITSLGLARHRRKKQGAPLLDPASANG